MARKTLNDVESFQNPKGKDTLITQRAISAYIVRKRIYAGIFYVTK
jgi:hypothetical protein